MYLLTTDFLGAPAWIWELFLFLVGALLAIDLLVIAKKSETLSLKKSAGITFMVMATATFFGLVIWQYMSPDKAALYFTTLVIEQSLSIDNVFVISLIFTHFAIPREYRHRVLMLGILLAMVFRALFIGFGTAFVANFAWVLYIFAAFLIWTGVAMLVKADAEPEDISKAFWMRWLQKFIPLTPDLHGSKMFWRGVHPVTQKAGLYATPLFLVFMAINVADLIFAVDSVPAALSITTDTFIIYTSNTFAILGLRALYFVIDALVETFHYLKTSIAALLIMIGLKIIYDHFFGSIDPILVLSLTLLIIILGIIASLIWPKKKA